MKKLIKLIFKDTRGQSLVEFALVVPVLMIILIAIVEFGRLWMTVNVLTSAAREGVRIAAITAPSTSAARSAAQNVLNGGQVKGATISVSGPNGASEVQVTVQVQYSPITAGLVPGLKQLTLARTSTMHWEN